MFLAASLFNVKHKSFNIQIKLPLSYLVANVNQSSKGRVWDIAKDDTAIQTKNIMKMYWDNSIKLEYSILVPAGSRGASPHDLFLSSLVISSVNVSAVNN